MMNFLEFLGISGKSIYRGLNKEINMRSGWEVKYAEYLDKSNVEWEYEPEGYKLSNGRIYIPDFKLSTNVIIEIKGWWREDAKIKWKMFCEEYPNLNKKVLMKNDLKDIGVL